MDKRLLAYIRKYHAWEIPGKKEAMQFYRAAYLPLNDNWPDCEAIKELKESYSSEELLMKYQNWENQFERFAEEFFNIHKGHGKFNLCPDCGAVARSPTFLRCEVCGCTWEAK